ncbi:Rieske (2Fe-2S) protein [Nocardia niwae]|uniref:Rieske 2Fe-2S domain-containing protein n=1 Tax=Nocardia niwae TaxID=626084 RepID=A0ABV2XE94_9NOCA|nr:Rieske 2Fe-2S domain-containing protein [Nocardia niwae]
MNTSGEAIEFDPDSVRRAPRAVWPDTFQATANGRHYAIFRSGAKSFAVERFCPHKGADLTRRGLPDFGLGVVTCLAHAHAYRLSDGACTRADSCKVLPVFPVDPTMPTPTEPEETT